MFCHCICVFAPTAQQAAEVPVDADRQSLPIVTNRDEAPAACSWCADGDRPHFLDRDGVLCSISGEDGILSHAYDVAWWDCTKFGAQMRCSLALSTTTAAEPDSRRETVKVIAQALRDKSIPHGPDPERVKWTVRDAITIIEAAVEGMPTAPSVSEQAQRAVQEMEAQGYLDVDELTIAAQNEVRTRVAKLIEAEFGKGEA